MAMMYELQMEWGKRNNPLWWAC